MGHARALITLPTRTIQEKILKVIISKGLNVRQTEELVRKTSSPKSDKQKVPATKIPERFKNAPAILSQKLGTKVNLRRNNNGEGAIVISFKNDEDLDKIISIIGDQ
jgi:ParB family chromosome partitioning protein